MCDELAQEAQRLVQQQQEDRQAQMEAVMEASFLRSQREKRVQHLKVRFPWTILRTISAHYCWGRVGKGKLPSSCFECNI